MHIHNPTCTLAPPAAADDDDDDDEDESAADEAPCRLVELPSVYRAIAQSIFPRLWSTAFPNRRCVWMLPHFVPGEVSGAGVYVSAGLALEPPAEYAATGAWRAATEAELMGGRVSVRTPVSYVPLPPAGGPIRDPTHGLAAQQEDATADTVRKEVRAARRQVRAAIAEARREALAITGCARKQKKKQDVPGQSEGAAAEQPPDDSSDSEASSNDEGSTGDVRDIAEEEPGQDSTGSDAVGKIAYREWVEMHCILTHLARFVMRAQTARWACESADCAPPSLDVRPLPLANTLTTLTYTLGLGGRTLLRQAGGDRGLAGWLRQKGWDSGWSTQACIGHPAFGLEAGRKALGLNMNMIEWRAWAGGVAEALGASAGVRARKGGFVKKWKFRAHGQRAGNFTLAGCVVDVENACLVLEGGGPSIPLALKHTTRHLPRGALHGAGGLRVTRRALRSVGRAREIMRAAADHETGIVHHMVRFRQCARTEWECVFECRGDSTSAVVTVEDAKAMRGAHGDCITSLVPCGKLKELGAFVRVVSVCLFSSCARHSIRFVFTVPRTMSGFIDSHAAKEAGVLKLSHGVAACTAPARNWHSKYMELPTSAPPRVVVERRERAQRRDAHRDIASIRNTRRAERKGV